MVQNQNNQPENYGVQFSGSEHGDERDPATIGDILPGVLEQIHERANNPVYAARAEVIRLKDAEARGEAVDEALAAAERHLLEQEEQVRKLQPPSE